MISVEKFSHDLRLSCIVPPKQERLDIRSADRNRPGMQFCGFYEHFAWERPQLIGIVEMAYLQQQTPEKRVEILRKYFS